MACSAWTSLGVPMSTSPIDSDCTVLRQSVEVFCHPQRLANSSSSAALRATTVCITGGTAGVRNLATLSHALYCARPIYFDPMSATFTDADTTYLRYGPLGDGACSSGSTAVPTPR